MGGPPLDGHCHDCTEAGPFLDLYGEDFRTDPYQVLSRLREQSWHAGSPIGTAVLRYHEVQTLLSMREMRTPGADFLAMQGITEGLLVETMRGFLLNADGEPHHRVRRLVSKAFTVRRVEDFRPAIRAIADELIDELARGEECDFVAAFADPFALRVLCRFVGIPEDVQVEVKEWTADVGLIFGFSVVEHSARIEAALRNLHLFIEDLLGFRLPPTVRRWAGVYSQTADGTIYHRSSPFPGVVLVTGPGGRGMTMSPAIAEETFQ